MERNNRTLTIISSYFKLHPTLDTNLDPNAGLLLLFSFACDSFSPCFSEKQFVNVTRWDEVHKEGLCHNGSMNQVVPQPPRLTAQFRWSQLGGQVPAGEKEDVWCWGAELAKSKRTLKQNFMEVLQPCSIRGCNVGLWRTSLAVVLMDVGSFWRAGDAVRVKDIRELERKFNYW